MTRLVDRLSAAVTRALHWPARNGVSSLLPVIAALLLPAYAAHAQNGLISLPASTRTISPGGVDLITGRYMYSHADLSIGDGDSALSLVRKLPTEMPKQTDLPFGNFTHNWNLQLKIFRISIYERELHGGYPPGTDYMAFVNHDNKTVTFAALGSSGYGLETRGPIAFLTFTGTQGTSSVIYTYKTQDGTEITFKPLGVVDGVNVTDIYATRVVRADGTAFHLEYAGFVSSSGNRARLRAVSSTRGYALLLEGSGALVSKVCAINLAIAPLPINRLCPAGAQATSYTYSSTKLATVTEPASGVWQFTYGTSGSYTTMGFVKPGDSAPWLVNSINQAPDGQGDYYDAIVSQAYVNGESNTYTYQLPPPLSGGSTYVGGAVTNALGERMSAALGTPRVPKTGPNQQCTRFPCPWPTIENNFIVWQQTVGPVSLVDGLNRVTKTDYCDPNITTGCIVSEPQSFTDPEGIKTVLTYSGRNITQARRIAKAGSGLPDVITSATYDCTYLINCSKPASMTDAKGNVTNYTYDSVHGGPLTETKPADTNGVQPVTRNEYVQRYAWQSNGSGGYVQASTPVWLLAATRTCRTTATVGSSCAGGSSDEVVTSYDYGPNSGPNNLLLRGKVVTADGVSLRTCYGYDSMGNKISETSPRAGLTVCP